MLDASVLVPTHCRGAILDRVLDAWERQEPTDLRFEVVVVDDGSAQSAPTDDTLARLMARRTRRFALRVATQPNAGPAAARNRALRRARGDLVLITGDDIEPAPDLLAQHLRAHREMGHSSPRPLAVVGLTRWPDKPPATATMRHVDGPGAQQFSYAGFRDGASYDFRHLYTSNVSLPRGVLAGEPGPFAEIFPAAAFEDAELGHRLAYGGLEIVYRAAAVAFHHHPYRADAFFRRQIRCGEMAALLWQRAPELEKWLGIEALERRRLELLAADRSSRQRLADRAERYEAGRDRALRVAERLDAKDPPGIDGLLWTLFALGYLEGLATAVCEPVTARSLLTDHLSRHLPAALRALANPMVGPSPVSAADQQALLGWLDV
ncbi:MAG: glycosyltransferase [Acidobacteriota bacterium]